MPPKVPDYGHHEADKELSALIRRLHLSYRQARIGLHEKIEKYLEEFEKEDAEKRALYDSGEMTHEAFMRWRQKMITDTRAWRDMLEQLSDDMTHQNQIAASMIDDTLPGVYALNHNYGTFEAEVGSGYDTTYTLYDKNTVKRLLTENEDLLPRPSVPVEKDKLWNKQHLQSAVLQGILTGEPMKDIAKRFQSVTDMTERAAMRNARTAVTGAENAGRIDSYIRAQNMGINMKQMWMATLDSRTRDSHAIMDGEQQEVGRKFSNGCRYPGDPQGAPGEIWNCRCTTVAMVEGADPYNPNLRPSEYLKEEGLTYEQWKKMHGERFYSKLFKDVQDNSEQQPTFHIAQGKDISGSWVRRPDKFDFEIEDVINAQGFDGLPRVVSPEEFDDYVKQANGGNGFIAQRTYSAPDQETLDLYREQLYNGKWYVDCSVGGSKYGQGMYGVADYEGKITDYLKDEIDQYSRLAENRFPEATEKARREFVQKKLNEAESEIEKVSLREMIFGDTDEADYDLYSTRTREQDREFRKKARAIEEEMNRIHGYTNIENFTIDASSKIIDYGELRRLMKENKIQTDAGVYAALLGYDGINTGDYIVVLNRTKLIFLGE